MVITVVISEGPQYHVRKLTVSGYQATSEDKIRALLKMKEGSVYSPKQLRDDAKAVADAYGSGGYVDLVCRLLLEKKNLIDTLAFGAFKQNPYPEIARGLISYIMQPSKYDKIIQST